MIVQSVSIGDTLRHSGASTTQVIPQSSVHFGSNQKSHSIPHTSGMSGLGHRVKTFMARLGLAAPLALAGCEGTDSIEVHTFGNEGANTVEIATFPNEPLTRPDGGATPKEATPHSDYQIRPTEEPARTPHNGPQIRPEAEPATKRHILDETGKAIEMLDKDGNVVSARVIREGKNTIVKLGEQLFRMA